MQYIEYNFTISPLRPADEILIAELSDVGFESFVETSDGIIAYIQKERWHNTVLEAIRILKQEAFTITYTCKEIAQVNWNAEWEKNFEPIEIEGGCTVRAPFHPIPNTPFDIVITPKMSFGTGHHETTKMMLQFLLQEELTKKRVLDMGCGTGVLAVLAEKKGAAHIDAVDIDPWCYKNTLENVAQNRCEKITVYKGDTRWIKDRKYDLIVANINRNILLEQIPKYAASLNNNGVLLLSGFYTKDMAVIEDKCNKFTLKFVENKKINDWVATKYVN